MEGVEDVDMLLHYRLEHRVLATAAWLLHHLCVRFVPNNRDEEIVALRLSARRRMDSVRFKLRGVV